jgi:hypothetical protein
MLRVVGDAGLTLQDAVSVKTDNLTVGAVFER